MAFLEKGEGLVLVYTSLNDVGQAMQAAKMPKS